MYCQSFDFGKGVFFFHGDFIPLNEDAVVRFSYFIMIKYVVPTVKSNNLV